MQHYTDGPGTGFGIGSNDHTEIVGRFYNDFVRLAAFLWRDGVFQFLPQLNPCTTAGQIAWAISNDGIIVGSGISAACEPTSLVWWEPDAPNEFHTLDLNTPGLVRVVAPPDMWFYEATEINDGHQILVGGTIDHDIYFDYILTPYHYTLSNLTPGIAGEMNQLTIANLEPGSEVYLIWGRNEGAQTINAILGTGGGNPPIDCPGAPILIQQPRGTLGPFTADVAGEVNLRFMIPPHASGQTVRMQVAVPEECRVSHVVEVTIE